MTDKDDNSGAAKPKRMPAELRLKLVQAVSEHLLVHGNRNYDLLRESPEFSTYIGRQLGETGDKRLDRIVKGVKRERAREAQRKRLRRAAVDAIGDLPEGDAENPARSLPSGAGASFSELLGDLYEQRRTLKLAQAAAVDEEGFPTKDFDRAARQLREVNRSIAELSKQYGALKSGEVADALISDVKEEFADQPERVASLISKFNDHFRRLTGLNALPSSPT